MTLLMSAPTLLFFHGIAPLALLSNLIFVPWCSLLVIPYLLIALLLELIFPAEVLWHWQLADLLLSPLQQWLMAGASMDYWWLLPAQTVFSALCIALLLLALFFLPAAAPKYRMALLLLPFIFCCGPKQRTGNCMLLMSGRARPCCCKKAIEACYTMLGLCMAVLMPPKLMCCLICIIRGTATGLFSVKPCRY